MYVCISIQAFVCALISLSRITKRSSFFQTDSVCIKIVTVCLWIWKRLCHCRDIHTSFDRLPHHMYGGPHTHTTTSAATATAAPNHTEITHSKLWPHVYSLALALVHVLDSLVSYLFSPSQFVLRVSLRCTYIDMHAHACVYVCVIFILSHFEKCKPRAFNTTRWVYQCRKYTAFRFFVGVAFV